MHGQVRGWDDGTTERGSSGCALFNAHMRVVGVLSGGSASCPDNTGFDLFGKIERAYAAGLSDVIAPGGEVEMPGRWAHPHAHMDGGEGEGEGGGEGRGEGRVWGFAVSPPSLAVVEGTAATIEVGLDRALGPGERVHVRVRPTDWSLVASLEPQDFTLEGGSGGDGGRGGQARAQRVTLVAKDDAEFRGNLRYHLQFEVSGDVAGDVASPAHSPIVVEYAVMHQDDETLGGDDMRDPIVIGALPFSFQGDTGAGYTNTYQSRCDLGTTAPDVVFEYTPARDETVDVHLCGGQRQQAFDSVVYVYEEGEELACMEGMDDGCGADGVGAAIEGVAMRAGRTYHIVVDGYDGASGPFAIDVSRTNRGEEWLEAREVVRSFSLSTQSEGVPMDTFPAAKEDEGAGTNDAAPPRDTFDVPRDTGPSSQRRPQFRGGSRGLSELTQLC